MQGRSEESIEDAIFVLVNHFDVALALLVDPAERARVCQLNALAGRRTKASTAYASASRYLGLAMSLLPDDAWERDPDATFALALDWAECEYLIGNFEHADELFSLILLKTETKIHRARVHRLREKLYQVAGRYADALGAGLEGLSQLGVTLPDADYEIESVIAVEQGRVDALLHGRSVDDLLAGPRMASDEACATVGLLADLMVPAYVARPALYPVLVLKGVALSLRDGNTEDSSIMFMNYAILQLGRLHDVPAAETFSDLALRLNDQLNDARLRGVRPLLRRLDLHLGQPRRGFVAHSRKCLCRMRGGRRFPLRDVCRADLGVAHLRGRRAAG